MPIDTFHRRELSRIQSNPTIARISGRLLAALRLCTRDDAEKSRNGTQRPWPWPNSVTVTYISRGIFTRVTNQLTKWNSSYVPCKK